MLAIPFRCHGARGPSNSKYLVLILLLLATVWQPYRTEIAKWMLHYAHHRIYMNEHGDHAQIRKGISLDVAITYPEPTLVKTFFTKSSTCLPIRGYRNNTLGYAVCNADPSYADIEVLLRDTIVNNINNLSLNCYTSSGIKRSRPLCQCMSFLIRMSDQDRGVRAFNQTAIPCLGLSVASLLYQHRHLKSVHIYGLPLQQDRSNVTCPSSSDLETLDLQNNGLTSTPFSSCAAYFRNLKGVFIENQQLRLGDKPLFPSSDGLNYLSLHHCSLHSLPRSALTGLMNLVMLNISNNNTSSLHRHVFHDLTNLTILRMDNNKLTTLDISVFQRMKYLQFLHLSGNHLNSIDGEVAIMPSLLVLDLSGNRLSVIRKNLFRDSPMLSVIILHNNSIRKIESGAFFNMTALRALLACQSVLLTYISPCSLFSSKLSTIAPLENLVNLEILDLGRNAIHNVSGKEISPATRLRYLYLDGNEMFKLGVLSNSSSIEFLDLRLNNLTYITTSCFNGLQYLKTLNLSYNYIKYVGAFDFPENVQKLGLSGNELSDLDSINQGMPQLHTLEIRHNNLTKFDINQPSVVNVDISENPLQNLSLQLCKRMPNLKDIFLEGLGIGHEGFAEPDLFGIFGCSCWRHVSLASNLIRKMGKYSMLYGITGVIDYSHNPLKSIPRLLRSDVSVKNFYFDNCSIVNIAPMAFQEMHALTYVELKRNNIKYFPEMGPGRIQYGLRKNPIVCSCHLRWLHGHPSRSSYQFTNCLDPITGSVEVFNLLPLDRLVCQNIFNCAKGCLCFGVNISTVSIIK